MTRAFSDDLHSRVLLHGMGWRHTQRRPDLGLAIKAERIALARYGGNSRFENPVLRRLSNCTFQVSGDVLVETDANAKIERPSIILQFDESTRRWIEL